MRIRSLFLSLIILAAPASFAEPPASGDDRSAARYYLAFLRRGAKWTPASTPETEQIQKAHMAHIGEMARAGHLVAAGPFGDNGELRGIFIFQVETMEQAKALTEADPAVKAGRLRMDIHQWMGPKGIGVKYAEEKKKNPQSKDEMVTYQMALLSRNAGRPLEGPADNKREAYIKELIRSGKLVAAGPFEGNGPLAEILILQNGSPEETAALVANHPGVKAGRLAFEIHPWWTARGAMP
ncbi:MAG TPA: YciI family protein [Blastocatellia bacterium]|jgi:uncharacterized protein YciI